MSGALAPGSAVGILGGGQLGRMLAIAAARLGYRTLVLEPERDCPAAQVAGRQIVAPYDDAGAMAELLAAADVVTYEFENVPVAAVEALAASVPLYPPARALEVAQDRVVEKSFLNGLGLATARFHPVDDEDDLMRALALLGGSGVLKTRRLGYDGKGQRVLGTGGNTPSVEALSELGGTRLVLEELVAFERELSIVAARGIDGDRRAFDPSENLHQDGILRSSSVPARIAAGTARAARDAAFAILDALDYVGVVGVEFFAMPDGRLIVNEIAPRVHNSGHWTEAACVVSQFEQHIRAVTGLPLGDPRRHSDCVMENLIGEEEQRARALLEESDLVLHLYGKRETRPGRKMGHFTRLSRG